MDRLRTIMRIQAIAFLGYAVGWLLAPEQVNGTILGWETDTTWPRVLGAVFLVLAWAEWQVIDKLDERLDLVWAFAAIPAAILAALLFEQLSGNYVGSDANMLVSTLVSMLFAGWVSYGRYTIDRKHAAV